MCKGHGGAGRGNGSLFGDQMIILEPQIQKAELQDLASALQALGLLSCDCSLLHPGSSAVEQEICILCHRKLKDCSLCFIL